MVYEGILSPYLTYKCYAQLQRLAPSVLHNLIKNISPYFSVLFVLLLFCLLFVVVFGRGFDFFFALFCFCILVVGQLRRCWCVKHGFVYDLGGRAGGRAGWREGGLAGGCTYSLHTKY